jgi:ribosomal protein L11 methyltransferase
MSAGEWTQIKVTVALQKLDTLVAIMSMIDLNLMIEDYSDIDLKTCYGDLIDESLLNADKTVASVSVFIPAEKSAPDALAFIKERAAAESLDIKLDINGVNEEDWANTWKAYYKTTRIGKNMVIVPAWESYEPKEGEVIIRMDPGMAFGTGTHETTRLVIRMMQDEPLLGKRVLDVGTGSGILSIAASKLGAAWCNAYDIDPVAVKVARENAKDGGCDNVTVEVSDLLADVDLSSGKYDFCVANIVSDIIIRMMPDLSKYVKDEAPVILSGIIESRADEVRASVTENGYKIERELYENDWVGMLIVRDIK